MLLCMPGACLKTLLDPEGKALSFAAFSPNGKFVLTAALGGKLTLWEYEKSRVVKTYQGAGPIRALRCLTRCSQFYRVLPVACVIITASIEDHAVAGCHLHLEHCMLASA